MFKCWRSVYVMTRCYSVIPCMHVVLASEERASSSRWASSSRECDTKASSTCSRRSSCFAHSDRAWSSQRYSIYTCMIRPLSNESFQWHYTNVTESRKRGLKQCWYAFLDLHQLCCMKQTCFSGSGIRVSVWPLKNWKTIDQRSTQLNMKTYDDEPSKWLGFGDLWPWPLELYLYFSSRKLSMR